MLISSVLPLVIYVWMISVALQLVGFGLLFSYFPKRLLSQSWALSRTSIWLLISLVIWFVAHLGLSVNTSFGIYAVLVVLAGLAGYRYWKQGSSLLDLLRGQWVHVLTQEILFLTGLTSLSIIRAFNPKILDLEKFMDAGFMASYVRSATLPAPDIWLAGHSINYYSFGHFLGSVMTRIWNLPISYGYNLLLGFVMGLALLLSYAVVVQLLSLAGRQVRTKSLFVGGIVGSLLVVVGGNTHTFWYWLTNHSFEGYWYADATRFIHNTIHEFPSYSFVVSDLHAHVWSLPFVLSFLIWVLIWLSYLVKVDRSQKRSYLWWALPVGMLMGTFVMTNAWDAMIFGLFLLVVGGVFVIYRWRLIYPFLWSALLVGTSAFIVAAPWIFGFESISEGVALVTERSPWHELIALWTGHVLLSILALAGSVIVIRRWRKKTIPFQSLLLVAIVVTAWILLAVPEVVYVKDIYTGHPRANTMFKLTYQAFILMSLAGGVALGLLIRERTWRPSLRVVGIGTGLLICATLMMHPYFSYRDYYGHWNTVHGLDGYAWLEDDHPHDAAGIAWLQEQVTGQPVILEAVGESYTTFDRVSAVTGLPTVLGWRVHEWLWRGGFDIPGQRTEEVRSMYELPLSKESLDLYEQYDVRYIFVGDKEYEAYPNISVDELRSMGTIVFEDGRTFIVELAR